MRGAAAPGIGLVIVGSPLPRGCRPEAIRRAENEASAYVHAAIEEDVSAGSESRSEREFRAAADARRDSHVGWFATIH